MDDLGFMQKRLSEVRHRVLVLSGKGGVGKSTLTKELGFAFGRGGWLTGLVDTDVCGPSLPRLTGALEAPMHASADGWAPIRVDENVSLVSIHFLMNDKDEAVVWRGPRKNGMIKSFLQEVAWGELDAMLIDTPPGTSDEHISLVNFLSQCGGVSGAVIVTTPQDLSVGVVRREINFCQKMNVPIIGFIENMSGFVCPKCHTHSAVFPSRAAGGSAADRLSAEYGPPVLGKVPLDPALMRACEAGVPLEDLDPAAPAVHALNHVAEKLVAALESRTEQGRRDIG